MRDFIVELFFKLGFDRIDSCANDKAIYVEKNLGNGKVKYYKLAISECGVTEYNEAWDYSLKTNTIP